MKKFFKNVLSIFLVFTMVCGSVTVYGAEADSRTEVFLTGDLEFEGDEVLDISDEEVYSSDSYEGQLSPYWSQFATDYYYNRLSAEDKQWWDQMEDICSALLEGTGDARYATTTSGSSYYVTDYAYTSNLTEEKADAFLKMFKYSNPQYYFLQNGYVFNTIIGRIAFKVYPEFAYGDKRASYTQQFKSSIDNCIAKIDMSLLPEQKERVVHDIVLGLADYKSDTYDQSAYSTFCRGVTVCSGYTQAFSMLGRAAGLDVIPVSGYGNGGRHAWNMINMHGIWYLVDATWDDNNSYYRYYNKTSNDGKHVADAFLNEYVPTAPYSSTDSYWSYVPGYFTTDDITYFSIDGTANYFAWGIDCGVTAPTAIPAATVRDNVCYIVAGSDAYPKMKTFVIRLYDILLDRDPDATGLANWANNLLSGAVTSASAVHGIVTSPEYTNKGLSTEAVVEEMYLSMLGRASDSVGKETWVSCLNSGMTVSSIVNGFSGSQEFAGICANYGMLPGSITITEIRDLNPNVTKFVSRCYTEALGRSADMDGLNNWCGALINKVVTPKQVAEQFVNSQEVQMRNLSNAEYVEMLYKFCMGRPADEAGKAYWVDVLNLDFPRWYVLNEFVNSQEFAIIVASFGL